MDRIQTHSGRKKAALLYVVTYIASCITKHSPDYYILMLGRFFGGIATSLLFSAFESWLVAEHFKVPPIMLPDRPLLDPSLFAHPLRRRAKSTRVDSLPEPQMKLPLRRHTAPSAQRISLIRARMRLACSAASRRRGCP